MIRRVLAMIAVIAVASYAVGCSVPTQDSATRIESPDVPFDLLDESPSTTTTTLPSSTPNGDSSPDLIYLVRNDRLEPVSRDDFVADPSTLLTLLSAGPTPEESDDGLRTAVVPDLAQVAETQSDLVTVDLTGEFTNLAPIEQRLALAQITYTVTQLGSISAVRFLVRGEETAVPRGDGSPVDRPVGPSDYQELAPRPSAS